MGIIEKLTAIQADLRAPKNQYNKFGGYSYRSCEDILEGVKLLLVKTKTALTISDEIVSIGNRFYVKATATLHDCEGTEAISNTAFAREAEDKKGMDQAQVTGAASSYARKYALNGLFCIDDTKDADSMDNTDAKSTKTQRAVKAEPPKAVPKPMNPKITQEQALELSTKIDGQGLDMEKLCKRCGVMQIQDLTLMQYENIMKNWDKVREACK